MHGYDNGRTVQIIADKIRRFSTSVVRLIPPPQSSRTVSIPQPGDRIEVYWPQDKAYCPGNMTSKIDNGNLVVAYDDGDREELDFAVEKWRFIEKETRFAESCSMIADFVQNKINDSDKSWIPLIPSSSLCCATDSFIKSPNSYAAFKKLFHNGAANSYLTVIVKNKDRPRFDQAKRYEVENSLKWEHVNLYLNRKKIRRYNTAVTFCSYN